MINKICGVVLAGVCLIMPARADEASPGNDHGRYILNKVADGFLRLDTQTGDVSICAQRTVGWACQAMPDDRAVLENEIARLRGENGALKKEILANGLPLPAGAAADVTGAGDNSVTLRLPSDGEVDSAVAYVGRMWHRFVDALARAQKQMLNKS
jgi:hypothetical protein